MSGSPFQRRAAFIWVCCSRITQQQLTSRNQSNAPNHPACPVIKLQQQQHQHRIVASTCRPTRLKHPRPEDLRPHAAILDAVCVQLRVPEKKNKSKACAASRFFSSRTRCCYVIAWGSSVSERVVAVVLPWRTLKGLAVQAFVTRDQEVFQVGVTLLGGGGGGGGGGRW